MWGSKGWHKQKKTVDLFLLYFFVLSGLGRTGRVWGLRGNRLVRGGDCEGLKGMA